MGVWRLAAVVALSIAVTARQSAAQDVAGLTFDVSVETGDSTGTTQQAGRGWIAGKRTRLDLTGGGMPTPGMPGTAPSNVSIIIHDSSESPFVTLVMHDQKKFMYPSRMMDGLREMMEAMAAKPKMTFSVSNIVVDSLGAGETVSGIPTRRFKLRADVSIAIEMMGEAVDESMHIESEGDYAEELSEFVDPLRDMRGVKALSSGMPWMDSAATAEMEKLARATPRGLALRQVDRVTGVTEGDAPPPITTTRLSNIKRTSFSISIFALPEDYTEMDMPQMPPMN